MRTRKPTHVIVGRDADVEVEIMFDAMGSDECALSRALSLASASELPGAWTVSLLPLTRGGFREKLYRVERTEDGCVYAYRESEAA